MQINELIKEAHDNAVKKGFYDEGNNLANLMMLLITELGEAYDELRKHPANYVYYVNDKPEGFLVEIADVMIRLCDMLGFMEEEYKRIFMTTDGVPAPVTLFNFEYIIQLKMAYNKTRPHKHDKKF